MVFGKPEAQKNIEGYLLGGKESNWWTIGLSVMATQASAITFLSTPGQAYMEGMGLCAVLLRFTLSDDCNFYGVYSTIL